MAEQLNAEALKTALLQALKDKDGVEYWFDSNGLPGYPYVIKCKNPKHVPGPGGASWALDRYKFTADNWLRLRKHFATVEDSCEAAVHALTHADGNVRIVDKDVEEEINRRVSAAVEQTRAEMAGMMREQLEQLKKDMVAAAKPTPPPPIPKTAVQDSEEDLLPDEIQDVIDWCATNGKKLKFTPEGRVARSFVQECRRKMSVA